MFGLKKMHYWGQIEFYSSLKTLYKWAVPCPDVWRWDAERPSWWKSLKILCWSDIFFPNRLWKQTCLSNRCNGAYWSVYLPPAASTRKCVSVCVFHVHVLEFDCHDSSHRTLNKQIISQFCVNKLAYSRLLFHSFSSTLFTEHQTVKKNTKLEPYFCSQAAAAVMVENKCNKPRPESALITIISMFCNHLDPIYIFIGFIWAAITCLIPATCLNKFHIVNLIQPCPC